MLQNREFADVLFGHTFGGLFKGNINIESYFKEDRKEILLKSTLSYLGLLF